jgi:hypothetical protein
MKRLKDVILCAATCVLFLCLIVALDVLTGVPFSYGLPFAALFAFSSYAFVMARGLTSRRAHGARRAAMRRWEEREDLPPDRRPCAIHSLIFPEPDADSARAGRAAPPSAAA